VQKKNIITIPIPRILDIPHQPKEPKNVVKVDEFMVYENTGTVDEPTLKLEAVVDQEAVIIINNPVEKIKPPSHRVLEVVSSVENFYLNNIKYKDQQVWKSCIVCKKDKFHSNSLLRFKNLDEFLTYLKYAVQHKQKLLKTKDIFEVNKNKIVQFYQDYTQNKYVFQNEYEFIKDKNICKFCFMLCLNLETCLNEFMKVITDSNRLDKQKKTEKTKRPEKDVPQITIINNINNPTEKMKQNISNIGISNLNSGNGFAQFKNSLNSNVNTINPFAAGLNTLGLSGNNLNNLKNLYQQQNQINQINQMNQITQMNQLEANKTQGMSSMNNLTIPNMNNILGLNINPFLLNNLNQNINNNLPQNQQNNTTQFTPQLQQIQQNHQSQNTLNQVNSNPNLNNMLNKNIFDKLYQDQQQNTNNSQNQLNSNIFDKIIGDTMYNSSGKVTSSTHPRFADKKEELSNGLGELEKEGIDKFKGMVDYYKNTITQPHNMMNQNANQLNVMNSLLTANQQQMNNMNTFGANPLQQNPINKINAIIFTNMKEITQLVNLHCHYSNKPNDETVQNEAFRKALQSAINTKLDELRGQVMSLINIPNIQNKYIILIFNRLDKFMEILNSYLNNIELNTENLNKNMTLLMNFAQEQKFPSEITEIVSNIKDYVSHISFYSQVCLKTIASLNSMCFDLRSFPSVYSKTDLFESMQKQQYQVCNMSTTSNSVSDINTSQNRTNFNIPNFSNFTNFSHLQNLLSSVNKNDNSENNPKKEKEAEDKKQTYEFGETEKEVKDIGEDTPFANNEDDISEVKEEKESKDDIIVDDLEV
jgi:hypothetical protein